MKILSPGNVHLHMLPGLWNLKTRNGVNFTVTFCVFFHGLDKSMTFGISRAEF